MQARCVAAERGGGARRSGFSPEPPPQSPTTNRSGPHRPDKEQAAQPTPENRSPHGGREGGKAAKQPTQQLRPSISTHPQKQQPVKVESAANLDRLRLLWYSHRASPQKDCANLYGGGGGAVSRTEAQPSTGKA